MTKTEKWHEPDTDALSERLPEIFPSFHLWGHTFSPKRVMQQTGFRGFAESNEPGQPNVAGPFRGHPHHHPYGSAIIRPPESISSHERLGWIEQKILVGHTRKFCKEYDIVESIMYLTVHYGYQQKCSLLLPGWFLRSLGDIPLVVTSIQEHEPPDSFAV
jgi:hypothetical protein